MKLLSMTERRLQDRMDAINLVLYNKDMDINLVKTTLSEIKKRGFDRDKDLTAQLSSILDTCSSTDE